MHPVRPIAKAAAPSVNNRGDSGKVEELTNQILELKVFFPLNPVWISFELLNDRTLAGQRGRPRKGARLLFWQTSRHRGDVSGGRRK